MLRIAHFGLLLFCACGDTPTEDPPPGTAAVNNDGRITTVEISNDQAISRDSFAYSAVPLPIALGLTSAQNLVLVDEKTNEVLPTQGHAISRYGGQPDSNGPIRWLGITTLAQLGPNETKTYELRKADAPPTFKAQLQTSQNKGRFTVDTGAATFVVDPQRPSLIVAAQTNGLTFAGHPTIGGPTITLDDHTVLSHDQAHIDSFEVTQRGPVRFEVVQKGHLVGADTRCATGNYERLGYTVILRLHAGKADIDLELHLRNECGDALNGPFTDQAIRVREAGFEVAVALTDPAVEYATDTKLELVQTPVYVEQTKGAGTPWTRRAQVRADTKTVVTDTAFSRPTIAATSANITVLAQMPWMRFREPQAIAFREGKIAFLLISDRLVFGEARGIWGHARITVLHDRADAPSKLVEAAADLERALLVRSKRADFDRAGLFPSLGTDAKSTLKTLYEDVLEQLHDDTISQQWGRAKTYGSQLWPDTQFDRYSMDFPNPYENRAWMNYWNPVGAELWEFLRTGNPKWAWDMGLTGAWLQVYSAYLNLGDHNHGNQNGFAVSSGGKGEGQWHRSSDGSTDYSYNRALHPAYVIQPSPALRDRFAQAGRTAITRYNLGKTDEHERERWVNQVVASRQAFQHYEMLANCAEFVPAETGRDCRQKLDAIVLELVEDNLRGTLCAADEPSAETCTTPQQFMINAMMYGFLMRYYRSFGDPNGGLKQGLVDFAETYYQYGLPKDAEGAIDVTGPFAARLTCSLKAGRVKTCEPAEDSDGRLQTYAASKPHTLGILLQASELTAESRLCGLAKSAFADPRLYEGFRSWVQRDAGYWKGISQALQDMVFAVGAHDRCGP